MDIVLLLIGLVLVFTLIYFFNQRRQQDETWQSYRKRHQENRPHLLPEQSTDPVFQFDQPDADREKNKPCEP
jgi:hypothetical protein